jgi:hypothetical protein
LASTFEADSATAVLYKTEAPAALDCGQTLTIAWSSRPDHLMQVFKYTILYITAVSLLSSLIVLRELLSLLTAFITDR